jgi:hypothetical protein
LRTRSSSFIEATTASPCDHRANRKRGTRPNDSSAQVSTVCVAFQESNHGMTIFLCRVHVHPQSYAINRVVRYFSPENEYLRGQVTLPSPSVIGRRPGVLSTLPATSFDTTVHCCDNDVVLECVGAAPSALKFRYCVGHFPSSGEFLVFIYNDRYLASLSEIWQFVVHSTMKYVVSLTADPQLVLV